MLVAIVAAAFVGCSKDATSDIENVISGNTVTVKFNASVEDTRATLEPNDGETAFAAAWEDNKDEIGIYVSALDENADNLYEKENVKGARAENTFNATFANAPAKIAYAEYCAYYPYTTPTGNLINIPFGSERTQIGNNYNSAYDIMISDKVNVDCEDGKSTTIGKDADGNAVVFPMKRQTAIAYFHFTTDDENIKAEKVVSAKLSVNDGVNIAAEMIAISYKSDNTISLGAKPNPTNSITISFDAATAPTAADFTAWFNVLPCTFDSMTLELETENYTATISRNAGSSTYEAGKLYKVSGKLTKWQPKAEDYSGTYLILAKGVNNTKPNIDGHYYCLSPNTTNDYQTATPIKVTDLNEDYSEFVKDDNAWTVEKNGDNYLLKTFMSNENKQDYIQSVLNANKAKLVARDAAEDIIITKNANGTYEFKSTNNHSDNRYLIFNCASGSERFAFYKGGNNQVKDLVLIPYVSMPKITPSVASVTVSPVAGSYEDITYKVSGFEMTPVVTATCDGAIVTAVEDADGTIKYTVSGNSTGAERTGTITLSADGAESVTINVIQQSNILAAPTNLSASGTTEKITATWTAVEHAESYNWELKVVDKETGAETLVQSGTYDTPKDSTAETVTLTIEGSFTAGEQYALYVKSAAEAPFVESEFAESEAFEIKAAGTEPEPVTVEMSTFTATSDNIDTNISYTTAKGGGTSNPAINGGQIRLYQNSAGTGGGTITITAKEGFILTSVTIGSSMGTSIAYTIGDSTTKSTTESLSANGKKEVTVNDKSITFYCMGTSTSTRLYVNYLSVTYQAQ